MRTTWTMIVLALGVGAVARADEQVQPLALRPEPALVASLRLATGRAVVAYEGVRATSPQAGQAGTLERRGVRVRLDGLTVERLDLADAAAAMTWAQQLAPRGPHVLEVRGRHVVIVHGPQAASPERVAGALRATWAGEAARAPRALIALTTQGGDRVLLGARGGPLLAEARRQRDAAKATFKLDYRAGERTVGGVRFRWADSDFESGAMTLADGRARAFQSDGPDGADRLPVVLASAGTTARLRDAVHLARWLGSGSPALFSPPTRGAAGALDAAFGR